MQGIIYLSLSILSLIMGIIVSKRYFDSDYNHIENMYFSLALLGLFFRFGTLTLGTWIPELKEMAKASIIVEMYSYWIFLILMIKLNQVHNNWSYKKNKILRYAIAILIFITLYTTYTISLMCHTYIIYRYHGYLLSILLLLCGGIIPTNGYYIFFRIGFIIMGLCKLIMTQNIYEGNIISSVFYLSGFVSVSVGLYFVYYSDKMLEQKEKRNHYRRKEDKEII